jgi:hypothetical protein
MLPQDAPFATHVVGLHLHDGSLQVQIAVGATTLGGPASVGFLQF